MARRPTTAKTTEVVERPILWQPHPGAQTKFLASSVAEVMYGGAAGGGKSDCLLVDALRGCNTPRYSAILFRRTYPDLIELIERSRELYSAFGGTYNGSEHIWRFPSGARVKFSHLQHDRDELAHKSIEYQYIAFDELTSFTEAQYRFLFSRLRSSRGIPMLMRSATNPGDRGHEWVLRRWAPWLLTEPRPDLVPGFEGPFVDPGTTLWAWRPDPDGPESFSRYKRDPDAISRTFIPALLRDNPSADTPEYRRNLKQLDPVTYRQQAKGDWLVKPAAGLYFKRTWTKTIQPGQLPADRVRWRSWDFAGTAKTEGKSDPDWTAGVLMSRDPHGTIYIEDVARERSTPGEIDKLLKRTAKQDGPQVSIFLPQDPGQAGKGQVQARRRLLSAYTVRSRTMTGDKVQRFGPFSSDAENGDVRIVAGAWNEAFLSELEGFPTGSHDDQADATSDGHTQLVTGGGGAGLETFGASQRSTGGYLDDFEDDDFDD